MCLNLKDPSDIQSAAGISGVDEADKRYFSALPVGQAIVKLQDRWHEPVLVQIPHVPLDKGAVTDELLQALCRGDLTLSALRRRVLATRGDVMGFRVQDWCLNEAELSFVEDVLKFPSDGVDRRYKRLGYSGDKGNRLKNSLVQRGVLDEECVSIDRTRRTLLRLSRPARNAMDSHQYGDVLNRASIAHTFWQQYYAQLFKGNGYRVNLEVPGAGGRIDIVARKDGTSIAIEIETGKSEYVENVKRALRLRYDRVLVVTTTESAMRQIESRLAQESLFIPDRVQVILRDKFDLKNVSREVPK